MKNVAENTGRWKALMEYAEKGDVLKLQENLGHKNLQSTWRYLERMKPLLSHIRSS